MKPLRINFAQASFRRVVVSIPAAAWLLMCIGLLMFAGAAVRTYDLMRQREALRAELLKVEAKLAKRQAQKREPKKFTLSEAQATAVNSAIAQLNLPWRDVFDAIESATPENIALLTLDPDAKKRLLRVTAETKTSEAMIAYIEQLKQQSFFDLVVLTRHEINEQDPNRPIRFQFDARWVEVEQ